MASNRTANDAYTATYVTLVALTNYFFISLNF